MFNFSDATPAFQALLDLAGSRLASAYRPKTLKAHYSHFTLFLQFLQFSNLDILDVSYSFILAFIEFLSFNNISLPSIQAYLSSLRSKFKSLSRPLTPFTHPSVPLTLCSIAINVPTIRWVKGIFDIQSLYSIVSLCSSLPIGYIYEPLFLTAYLVFYQAL